MNRYKLLTGSFHKSPWKLMHQCAYGDFNAGNFVRCRTMLSDGSPDHCPEHEVNHRYMLAAMRDRDAQERF